MPLVVSFPGPEQAPRAEVGGKGHSLVRMAAAGLPVPPGAVLTTTFFAPWLEAIRSSAAWAALDGATPDAWAALCAELQTLCPALPLGTTRREVLEEVGRHLAPPGDGGLLAVRSSSPEEDLASASFAGGYETRLGVCRDGLEEAVRACFASSLDERVLVYKQARGLDPRTPRIAVVVQRQIASQVAGVAFSINPLTNDYDEAVIDANWGLGESVVAGRASPDHFVVDKVDRRIVERTLGAKRVSTWLDAGGGTVEREGHRADEPALDDARLAELTDLAGRIETLFAEPTDIEWAYDGEGLHVLQARPVTAYVPLPPEMVTRPGARRMLYADVALASGLTINAPISPMGIDWMEECVSILADMFLGDLDLRLAFEETLWFCAGGRMYQNLSNVLWLASPRTLARASTTSDALMAEILAGIDAGRYRAAVRPPWARLRMLRYAPRFLWRMRRFLGRTAWALLAPERAHRAFERATAEYETGLIARLDPDLSLDELRRRYGPPVMRYLFDVTMPALTAGLFGLATAERVVGRKSPEAVALGRKLGRGFTGNVVAGMGIAMWRLARRLAPSDVEDLPGLVERVERRRMPAAFLEAWDEFLATYGWRGPHEMDLASPRYADDPAVALRQIAGMAVGDPGLDPEAARRRLVAERREAFEALVRRAGWWRRRRLRRAHRLIELFAGARDTPKHHNLLFHHAVRRRVLVEGRRLAAAGRLDAPEDVFDLELDDLEAADHDAALDLRALRAERTRFLRTLAARVASFPPVIDSRGRILRPPPRPERPGELSGMAVSPGVATGPVKVLRDPREKPVARGDVLVAYTTDPGWTPLFVNAAAVVLEVGGVLQHGAVVAREYGKPCVAGIDRVLTRLHDGQRVEVDGTAGVVRVLSPDD